MQLHLLQHVPGAAWAPEALARLDSEQTLVLAFGAAARADDPGELRRLARAFPRSHVLGCSTSGEIFGTEVRDDSIAAAVLRFEGTRLASVTRAVGSAAEAFDVGRDVAAHLAATDLRGVLVLSEGLGINGSELVRGLNARLPAGVVVTGGLAGDGSRFERTWVLDGDTPRAGIVRAVGLYGDRVRIGHGSQGGWDAFGPQRRVTRAQANVLYELDGKPALELYKQYLGERADGLPATALLFPLALRAERDAEKLLVRTVLAVDEAAQSLTFAGDIPADSSVQLMRADFERLVDGAIRAAELAGAGLDARGDVLSIAISCVGRRLVLGERAEDEVEGTLEALPPATRQIGFYSYGEISPWASGSCDLHNQTMTLTTISES